MSKKIAILFPGVGYTCDRPLLYYSGRLAKQHGYQTMPVSYSLPSADKNGKSAIKKEAGLKLSAKTALAQVELLLSDISWKEYDEILFLSKSLGTVVSTAYAKKHGLSVKNVLFTPLKGTFQHAGGKCIAFHGTADPWAETELITQKCKEKEIPLFLTADANHSLEAGDVLKDLEGIRSVMRQVEEFIIS